MVDSDQSDNGESHTTTKRSREDHSEDEKIEHPSKRPRSKSPDPLVKVESKKDTIVQVTNGSDLPAEEKKDVKINVEYEGKNGDAMDTDDDTEVTNKEDQPADVKTEPLELVEKIKEEDAKETDESKDTSKEIETEEDEASENKSKDSEVVDGLELSVECASDKEGSSSESDKEKDPQPRPKTIIVKAKPNDSELEVGSSEAEKSDVDKKVVANDAKNKKRIGKRKSVAEASSSKSEESLESNSDGEDYSPRTKKKLKKTVTPKKAAPQKSKAKKERESKKKTVTDSEDEKSESEDEEMNLADRAKKITDKNTDKSLEKDKSDSESGDEEDSPDESVDKSQKNGRRKRGNVDPMDDKTIKMLRKYMTTAGIRVRYEDVWSGCKTNKQRADRLRKLLEEKGIKGRPTLEKCKKWKAKNAAKLEVAELDTSNIISEGRVTRSRRIEANKAALGTPPKHREARNLFKRIQPVCDSDTE